MKETIQVEGGSESMRSTTLFPSGSRQGLLSDHLDTNAQQHKLAMQFAQSRQASIQRTFVESVAGSPRMVAQRMHMDTIGSDVTLGPQAVGAVRQNKPASESHARSNQTGLPDNLKSGVETLSGVSMDDVKVHYNSSKPAQMQALAYAQAADIHIAPGQERHLPHEAWHVAQQKQGRVRPTMQAKGVSINDDPSLEHEADVMGRRAVNVTSKGMQMMDAGDVTTPSAPLVQRQRGIPTGTHVVVNDGGPLWYGQISTVDDAADTYDVRVGGTEDRIVRVPQVQVDYHEMVEAAVPVRVGMERWVNTLPPISLAGDMVAFAQHGQLAQSIVTAQGQMAQEQAVAQHTIAMFEYMDRHATAIGQRILADFVTITVDRSMPRKAYLESLSSCLSRKILRGLWIGDDDKGLIQVDALDPITYFRRGKALLLAKAGQALAANKTLVSLLENLSHNLDAKSYGRRQESTGLIAIGALGAGGVNLAPPQPNVPVPHNKAGYVYYLSDYMTQVAANALVANNSYVLYINNSVTCSVTVLVNNPNAVTFSQVE
jgi:hypothetical protein